MNEVPQPKMFNSKKYLDGYDQIDWGKKKTESTPEPSLNKKCIKCGREESFEIAIRYMGMTDKGEWYHKYNCQ